MPENKKKNNIQSLGKIKPNLIEYKNKDEIRHRFEGAKILIQKFNNNTIRVYIPYHQKNWVDTIKKVHGRKWNAQMTCWELPYVKSSFRFIKKFIGLKHAILDLQINADIPDEVLIKKQFTNKKGNKKKTGHELLNEQQRNALMKLEEYFILKRYSYSTIRAYKNHLISLFHFFPKLNPTNIQPEEVRKYILHKIKFKKIAASTQYQIINAYKTYCEKILGHPKLYIELPKPKRPVSMPNVLSQKEIHKLITAPNNLKHKLILLLIYSSGLRLSEVVKLRKKDVNFNRKTLHIKAGKGKKDRIVSMSNKVVPLAKKYLQEYSPSYWFFEGYNRNQYSVRSVQSIFYNALEKSKVNAYATVHTLRHSYATHCVENGYSIALVQRALGHNSIKTTEIYLHLSNKEIKKLKSPLDNFEL